MEWKSYSFITPLTYQREKFPLVCYLPRTMEQWRQSSLLFTNTYRPLNDLSCAFEWYFGTAFCISRGTSCSAVTTKIYEKQWIVIKCHIRKNIYADVRINSIIFMGAFQLLLSRDFDLSKNTWKNNGSSADKVELFIGLAMQENRIHWWKMNF